MDNDQPVTNIYPPEHVSARVQELALGWLVSGIENWDEGAWDDFTVGTTQREVLSRLVGYLGSVIEMDDEDWPELARPFMQEDDV